MNFESSISSRLMAVLILAGIIAIVGAWAIVPMLAKSTTVNQAVSSAQDTVTQFKTLRAYYTNNVIKKALANGLQGSFDHKTTGDALPLPATVIHDLSDELKKKGTTVGLFSPYPFPNRKNRQLDRFQRDAWAALQANPKQSFSREEEINGKNFVRVGVADTMAAQACVDCHNSRADTPKADWQLGEVRGVLEVKVPIDAALAAGASLGTSIAMGIALVFAAAIGVFALVLRRTALEPMEQLTKAMGSIANGRLDEPVPGQERKDEIGTMAKSVVVLQESAVEKQRLEKAREADKQTAETQRRGALMQLANDLQAEVGDIAERLAKSASGVEHNIAAIVNLSNRSADQGHAVMATNEELTANVQSMALGTEQLVTSIQEIAAQIAHSSGKADGATDQARKILAITQGLVDDASRIHDVIGLISEIAEQTNLLALNATIESARAGDAGKGFAVVAQEVKALAAQTSQATGQISQRISAIQKSSQDTMSAMTEISQSIDEISETSTSIASAIEEQNVATSEIAAGAQKAAQATINVSASLNEVQVFNQKAQDAAATVGDESSQLSKESSHLSEEIERFLAKLRAA